MVLENPELVMDICGPQDANLRIVEDMLKLKVFSRGNEIIVDADNSDKIAAFKELLSSLVRFRQTGQTVSAKTINDLWRSRQLNGKVEYLQFPQGKRIYPLTDAQQNYLDKLFARDLVLCYGPAGTGKTFLAIASALAALLSTPGRRLVITRPVVEAGESLGFLPGDLNQKLSPYLRPLYDAMDRLMPIATLNRWEEDRIIEIAPLAYMRGRSLRDSHIILDEGQNASREQMKMFLTRMGEGSKMVVTGDITQIDLPKKENSGLLQALGLLKNIPEVGIACFTTADVQRNPVVKKIIKAYEEGNQS